MTGSSITTYLTEKILKLFGATPVNITAPANVFNALYTALPTDTAASGTEASYTSYDRPDVSFNNTPAAASPTGSYTSNTAAFSHATSSGGGTQIMLGFQIMDANAAGNGLMWGALDTPISIASGQTPTFDIDRCKLYID